MSDRKIGGGGKYQCYIPKGFGHKSGQYCKEDENFAISEHCTGDELRNTLSEDEIRCVELYTDSSFGISLNKAIRKGVMSESQEKTKNLIIKAIRSHRMRNAVTVYRGITVSFGVYLRDFLAKYISNTPIVGSVVCSTSREPGRALMAAEKNVRDYTGIVFEINIPKGYHALPIEEISSNPGEKEILLESPKYMIEKIENRDVAGYRLKWIKVKLLGD